MMHLASCSYVNTVGLVGIRVLACNSDLWLSGLALLGKGNALPQSRK